MCPKVLKTTTTEPTMIQMDKKQYTIDYTLDLVNKERMYRREIDSLWYGVDKHDKKREARKKKKENENKKIVVYK